MKHKFTFKVQKTRMLATAHKYELQLSAQEGSYPHPPHSHFDTYSVTFI